MAQQKKRKVNFYLPEEIVMRLYQFVGEKYIIIRRGVISAEVSCALDAYMAEHRGFSTHTQTTQTILSPIHSPNPLPSVIKAREQVKDYLRSHFGYDVVYQIPRKHLVEAIRMTRGADDRTVAKWMKLFVESRIMKWVGAGIVEFL